MELFIEPVDVWLFRDGRPFDAGSGHRAESLFPPYPTVVQGAIRSHQLALSGVDLRDRGAIEKEVGTSADYGRLKLRGPLLAKDEAGVLRRYFPLPADALSAGDPTGHVFKAVRPQEKPKGLECSVPTPWLLLPAGEPQKADLAQWLDESSLYAYLKGDPVVATPAHKLFIRESRVGIAHDAGKRTVRTGMLYEAELIRPQEGVGLWMNIEGYTGWPSAGILRMGGEARGGTFRQWMPALKWPDSPVPLPARFLVYFATPTYFEAGWQPECWDRFFEGEIKPVAAALNRYEAVGGFDWAAPPKSPGAHRPSRRYVPAGSIYYFSSKGQATLQGNLTQSAITDYGAEIGFGQNIIKEW